MKEFFGALAFIYSAVMVTAIAFNAPNRRTLEFAVLAHLALILHKLYNDRP